MKQKMSQEQIQLTAVHALRLPPLLRFHTTNHLDIEHFHGPLASAVNHLRELGTAQLFVHAGTDDSSEDGFPAKLEAFIRELLDTVQLPGEKIKFEFKIGAKTGLIVVTLFKEQPNT